VKFETEPAEKEIPPDVSGFRARFFPIDTKFKIKYHCAIA